MNIDLGEFTIWFNGVLVAIIIFVAKQVGDYVAAIIKSNKQFDGKLSSVSYKVSDLSSRVAKLHLGLGDRIDQLKTDQEKTRRSIVNNTKYVRQKLKVLDEFKGAVQTHHEALRLSHQIHKKQKKKIDDLASRLIQLNDELVIIKSASSKDDDAKKKTSGSK